MEFPTFDEWYVKKYGTSFENRNRYSQVNLALKELVEELKIYVTEMVREKLNGAS